MESTPTDKIHRPPYKLPMQYADICNDDFIALQQGTPNDRLQAMRVLLHVLDSVFQPLETTNNPHQQEPASIKTAKRRRQLDHQKGSARLDD